MIEAATWWLTIEVIGVIAFPIAFFAFRFLPDRGYSLAKPLGLLLVTYGLWISALARVLPNTRTSIILILLAIAAISLLLVIHLRRRVWNYLRDQWQVVLVVEIVFLLVFVAIAYYTSFVPEIGEGEEPMDFAYLNSILRSRHFPPQDPWLSGHSIPYYYFGHLMVATLTKVTGIAPAVAFNLGSALIAALVAAAAFGIAYNLVALSSSKVKAVSYGFVGVIFLMLLSNLDGVFELMSVHGIGSRGFYSLLDINGLEGTRPSDAWYPTDLWWGRAQVMSGSWDAHHFPFVAVLLGGLHAEYLSLPFIMLVLGMALNLLLADGILGFRFLKTQPLRFLLMALAVGALVFVDSWAFPAFAFFLAGTASLRNYFAERKLGWALAARSSAFALTLVTVAVLLFLPYFFDAPRGNSGPRFVEVAFRQGWPIESAATRPNHFFLYFLPLVWIPASFASFSLVSGLVKRPNRRQLAAALLPAFIPLTAWAMGVILRHQPSGFLEEVQIRDSTWATLGILISLVTVVSLALVLVLSLDRRPDDTSVLPLVFVLAAAGLGVYLIFGAELFWIKVRDAWENRTPTTFRLSFHAWILLSIAATYGLYFILSRWRLPHIRARFAASLWALATLVVIASGLIYPVISVASRTDGFSSGRSLDGLALVKRFEPDEYAAVKWLNGHVSGTPVILEAPGPEYGSYARISVRTGLPTILGWPSHELKFRGSLAPQAGRQEDMDTLYQTRSPVEAQHLIDKYDVEYVYVGSLERQQYSQASLEKFAEFMDVAFSSNEVTIYQGRETGAVAASHLGRDITE